MGASIRVANPDAQRNRDCRKDLTSRKAGRALPSWAVPSKSAYAGTRKMVNYACAG